MDLNSLIQLKRERFEQLEHDIADPCLFDNRKRAEEIMREHASLKQLLAKWAELESVRKQLDDNRELAMSRDVEIAAMADDEIPDLEKRVADLEREIQIDLLPPGEQEREIRGCAVHACELIARELGIPARDLDVMLWNRGQGERYKSRPRHRTRTVYY